MENLHSLMLAKAEKELNNFLEKNPEMQGLQNALIKELDEQEDGEGRMKVLASHMKMNIKQLEIAKGELEDEFGR